MTNDEILAGLNQTAKGLAMTYLVQCPGAVLTSGRRSTAEQASAMASNVVLNRRWIQQTYIASEASQACQSWVDDQTEPLSLIGIATGLLSILQGFGEASLRQLSWHLAGDAFDVQPTDDPQDQQALQGLIDSHVAAGGQGRFLSREGGLTRWHVQAC